MAALSGGALAGAGASAGAGGAAVGGAEAGGYTGLGLAGTDAGLAGAMSTVGGATVPTGAVATGAGLAPAVGSATATGASAAGLAPAAGGAAAPVVAGGAASSFFPTASAALGTVLGANALFGDPLNLGGDNGSNAANASADAARQAAAISQDQWNYYKTKYQPLETSLIQQAQQAGSPEEYAAVAGRANADVTGAFDQAQKQTQSRMQSYGINPGSPAYQNTAASVDLAQGAAKAGALTNAYNQQKNLAYSKGLDVVGLGKGIPAQSAASSASAANAGTQASNSQFLQNQRNQQNIGYGLESLTSNASKLYGAAGQWFGSTPTANSSASMPGGDYMTKLTYANAGSSGNENFKDGGPVSHYASGGLVDLKAMLKKRGMSDEAANKVITPHMKGLKPRGYADGGGVGRQGNAMPDQSNMGAAIDHATGQVIGPGSGTSDSVPAQIDGQQPAALSNGEYVMNIGVQKLSPDEILEAINQAGLKKRQQGRPGLEPQNSNDVPINAGMTAYADGGGVGLGYMTPQDVAAGGKPTVLQKHGGISTEKTITIEADGRHYVIPTIINGQSYTPEAAINAFMTKKNKPIAVFDSADEAKAFAEQRSRDLDTAFGGAGRLMKGPSDPAIGGVMNKYARGGRVYAHAGLGA